MDPITIISGATVAFNALKKGFALGKDLQSMSGQLSKWAGHMSDLGQAEKQVKNPPWWKSLSGSVEAEAIEVFAANKKAEQMRQELKDHISWTMGPSVWDELVRIEAKIRKQKREHEYRKAELQEAIVTWSVTGILVITGIGAVVFFAWWMSNG